MASKRKTYDAEYIEEAVGMVVQSGQSIASVANLMSINEGTLGNWVRKWRAEHPEPNTPLDAPGRLRLAEVEAENR